MCMWEDCDEQPEFSSKETRRARIGHKCTECNRLICKGEIYQICRMMQNGEWYTFKLCAHCLVAVRWLVDNCGGFVYDGILEDIQQHSEEYPMLKFGLYRLVVGMRRRWRRFSDDAPMPVPALPRSIADVVAAA